MNSLLILSLILVAFCDQIICKVQLPEGVTKHSVEIPLDHFDANNNAKWNLTYLQNKKYCVPNGPIFIFTKPARYMTEGQFHALAEKNNGCLFTMEIRFYGNKFPVDYLGRLEYLSVDQIVEDIAYFVDEIKIKNPELQDSKIIFGGSDLHGSFIVWFKQRYPEKIDAAWVANAPIEAKLEVPDLNNVLGDLIREVGGNQCHKRVHNAMNSLSDLFAEGRGDEIKKLFKICRRFDSSSKDDVAAFFEVISFGWSVKSIFRERIESACSKILNGSSSLDGVLSEIAENDASEQDPCWIVGFNGSVGVLSEPDTSVRIHQLYYQGCNEFGWWATSRTRYDYFGRTIPLDYYVKICAALFGETYTEEYMRGRIDAFNLKYGGKNPDVENIFFTQSRFDTFRSLTHGKALIYPDPIFGNDFDDSTSNDSELLRNARERVSQSITDIINDEYSNY